MKEAIWLTIAVLLLALIGMDAGLHVVGMLACSERSEAQQNDRGGSAGLAPIDIGGNAIPSRLADQQQPHAWCTHESNKALMSG